MAGHVDLGFFVAIDAVLGAKKCDQIDVGGAAEDIDRAFAPAVNSSWMGEQSHALATKFGETVGFQRVDAQHDGKDRGRLGLGSRGRVHRGHGRGQDRGVSCGGGGRVRLASGGAAEKPCQE